MSYREDVLACFRDDPTSTVRDIAGRIGISINVVSFHLRKLERERVICRPLQTGKPMSRLTRGNHSDSAKRSEDGRKGRGRDAFTSKVANDEAELQRRIEQVVEKAQAQAPSSEHFHIVAYRLPLKVCKVG